jgi:hypothetical protein
MCDPTAEDNPDDTADRSFYVGDRIATDEGLASLRFDEDEGPQPAATMQNGLQTIPAFMKSPSRMREGRRCR